MYIIDLQCFNNFNTKNNLQLELICKFDLS